MYIPLVLILAMSVAALQLLLCFRAKRLWIKLLPLLLLLGTDMLCWGVYFSGIASHIYGGDFAAYIYGLLLALFAAADIGSWGVYRIVKEIQKKRFSE